MSSPIYTVFTPIPGGSGSGNVVGPSSSTAHAIAAFADTSGTLLESAALKVVGAVLSPVATDTALSLASTGTGNILLKPAGSTKFTLDTAGGFTFNAATAADLMWGTAGGGCIGVATGQLLGTDRRPNNAFFSGTLVVGNIGSVSPPYGLNNSLLSGIIFAGNNANGNSFMGASSVFNSTAYSFIGFGKDGGFANAPAFNNSNVLADQDVYLSVMHLSSAKTDLLKFASSGSFTFMKSSAAHLLWNTDGAGSIGASGASRPDKAFVKTSVNAPLFTLPNDAVNDANPAADVTVHAANKTAGTGDGGNVIINPGTSVGGTRGYTLVDGNVYLGDNVGNGVGVSFEPAAGAADINVSALDGVSDAGFSSVGGGAGFSLYTAGATGETIFTTYNNKAFNISPDGSGVINCTKQTRVASLGVGNRASATTPGTVVKKIEVFDASGVSLGFIAVYDAIS